ncbi:hypothetical protein BpHYR1_005799 [Brachionus plicatilis]|uniref:Uncharacterized protein n=1 Tax=Brachionus plicatilis TaxID=10195 RepID=A0A3M7QDM2_BRAPC|nr:hypothetical protein BpHYR1_005799 [Brachionus plicatilis]
MVVYVLGHFPSFIVNLIPIFVLFTLKVYLLACLRLNLIHITEKWTKRIRHKTSVGNFELRDDGTTIHETQDILFDFLSIQINGLQNII